MVNCLTLKLQNLGSDAQHLHTKSGMVACDFSIETNIGRFLELSGISKLLGEC